MGWYPIDYIFDLLGPVYIEVGFKIFISLSTMNVATFLQTSGFVSNHFKGRGIYDFLYTRHFNPDKTIESMISLRILQISNPALRRDDFQPGYRYMIDYKEANKIHWSDVAVRYSFYFLYFIRIFNTFFSGGNTNINDSYFVKFKFTINIV
uniref:NADH-plastoquinone oxidoreductase subunit 5 n=1 Tax=Heterorhabditis bacteriophora TaxID=37862 RepID=A0A1I7X4Q0_HETBA